MYCQPTNFPEEPKIWSCLLSAIRHTEVAAMLDGKKTTLIIGGAVLAFASIGAAFAQTYSSSQSKIPEERAEHSAMLRYLPPSDREAYLIEHHQATKKRAESMGLSPPDEPPTYGRGFGRGGPGYGYGYNYLRRVPGYGYGRGGPGYWGPAYWGPPYRSRGDR
jgi:hypothetical protein